MFQVVLLDFKYLTFFILDLFQNDRSSPPEVFSGKKCSENMLQIYRTPIPKYDFEKVAKHRSKTYIKSNLTFKV